jgi:uncharacterized protein (DUF2141 family)
MAGWVLFALTLAVLAKGALSAEPSGTIRLIITGFKDSQGQVLIGLFRATDGFPAIEKNQFILLALPIAGNRVETLISNLNRNRYAIAIVHDRNGNRRLDSNWLGIPAEGVGASNDAKGFMGPPAFSAAAFDLNQAELELSIRMTYL